MSFTCVCAQCGVALDTGGAYSHFCVGLTAAAQPPVTLPETGQTPSMSMFADKRDYELATTRQQLLAAQVEVKRLRDAIADYVEANNASWLEISNAAIAAGTSTVVLTDKQAAALNQYCALRDAIATPPDLSALSLHAANERKEGAMSLRPYARHRNDKEMFCESLKHSDCPCTCGLDALRAELDQAPQGEKL